MAHKIARIVYAMISSGKAYSEKEAFKITQFSFAKRRPHLRKQAA